MRDIRLKLSRAIRFTDGAPDVTGLPCDQISDAEGAAYMQRFHLLFTKSRSVRFHHILASDPVIDALHDHPWDYTTFLLSGRYLEITPSGNTLYEAPCVLGRKAESLHRLVLDSPAWTYIVCGPVRRNWGYQTEHGWVPWRQHAISEFGSCGEIPAPRAITNGRSW